MVQGALREAEERSLEAALAGEAAPSQPATPEAPPSVQAREGAPQPARDEAVVRRLEQAEDELAAVQGTLREVERALEAARAGDLPQSALRALVAAGGAVSAAVTTEAGKGRWRRWFHRWQSRWDG